jgi:hypothetical protein
MIGEHNGSTPTTSTYLQSPDAEPITIKITPQRPARPEPIIIDGQAREVPPTSAQPPAPGQEIKVGASYAPKSDVIAPLTRQAAQPPIDPMFAFMDGFARSRGVKGGLMPGSPEDEARFAEFSHMLDRLRGKGSPDVPMFTDPRFVAFSRAIDALPANGARLPVPDDPRYREFLLTLNRLRQRGDAATRLS